jgi:hypothetical protein
VTGVRKWREDENYKEQENKDLDTKEIGKKLS